jgi:hypothetical protein
MELITLVKSFTVLACKKLYACKKRYDVVNRITLTGSLYLKASYLTVPYLYLRIKNSLWH